MANNVDIIIRTITDQSQKAIKSFKVSWTELTSAIGVASHALGAIKKVTQDLVGEYMKEAQAVRELALATGTTTEETSRMMRMFGDMGINTDNLKTAMIAMNKAGIAPTIENIAQMSDEYRAIQDPIKRTEYLTERLGTRGVEVGKVFEMTGQQIRAAGAAIDESLVFDDAKIERAEKLRIAQNNLNDSFEALKYEAIGPIIPVIADATAYMAAYIQTQREGQGILDLYANTFKFFTGQIKTSNDAVSEGVELGADFYESLAANEAALRGTIDATEEAGQRYYDLAQAGYAYMRTGDLMNKQLNAQKLALDAVAFAVRGQLGKAHAQMSSEMTAINDRAVELRQEIERLTKQGYSPNGKKITELNNELENLNDSYADSLVKMQAVTAEMIYQNAAASDLSADALLELGRALGVVSEKDYVLITAMQKLNDIFDSGKKNPELYAQALLDLNEAAKDGTILTEELAEIMKKYDGTTANFNLHTNYTSSGSPPPVNPGAGVVSPGVGGGSGGRGGDSGPGEGPQMMGPQSFGFDGGGGPSGGAGAYVVVNISAPGGYDEHKLARLVKTEFDRVNNQNRASGIKSAGR